MNLTQPASEPCITAERNFTTRAVLFTVSSLDSCAVSFDRCKAFEHCGLFLLLCFAIRRGRRLHKRRRHRCCIVLSPPPSDLFAYSISLACSCPCSRFPIAFAISSGSFTSPELCPRPQAASPSTARSSKVILTRTRPSTHAYFLTRAARTLRGPHPSLRARAKQRGFLGLFQKVQPPRPAKGPYIHKIRLSPSRAGAAQTRLSRSSTRRSSSSPWRTPARAPTARRLCPTATHRRPPTRPMSPNGSPVRPIARVHGWPGACSMVRSVGQPEAWAGAAWCNGASSLCRSGACSVLDRAPFRSVRRPGASAVMFVPLSAFRRV